MNPEWKMSSVQERRKAPRFECQSPRECPVDFDGAAAGARLFDLSREGLSLQSPSPLQVNQTYHLKISDPKSRKKISCEARIMWTRTDEKNQCACGASIVQMDPAEKMDLLDILYDDWKKVVLGKN